MPRIPSKKTKRYRIIKDSVEMGMSGNKIQKLLQDVGLGVRRKNLYAEIRSIKGKQLSKEKSKSSIPKKYRKEAPKKWKKKAGFGKVGYIYRGSLVVNGVPFHSTPFNRHYLGFRLNIFSFDKDRVRNALKSMKKQFIYMIGDILKSENYAKDVFVTMGTEETEKINVMNPENLNGKWFFAKEENGVESNNKSGYI